MVAIDSLDETLVPDGFGLFTKRNAEYVPIVARIEYCSHNDMFHDMFVY